MKLASTLKMVSLTTDPEYIEDGAVYFNPVEQCVKLSYNGQWIKLIDELNLELSFLRDVKTIPTVGASFTWTLLSSEQNAILLANSASGMSLVIPNNNTENIEIGSSIKVVRSGPGSVTFDTETGVTLQKADDVYLTSEWTTIDLIKIDTNQWVLDGEFPDIY